MSVQNKAFIYRGLEYEQIRDFTQRIQTEFPQAKILPPNTPPDDTIRSSDGQYIQICAVKPIPEPNPKFDGLEVDERILKYYAVNHVRCFFYDRATYRGGADKDNEFKNLWIERITYTIESELPGILKWFEIVDQRIEQLCPPQCACETVEKNNKQLKQMSLQYRANPHECESLSDSGWKAYESYVRKLERDRIRRSSSRSMSDSKRQGINVSPANPPVAFATPNPVVSPSGPEMVSVEGNALSVILDSLRNLESKVLALEGKSDHSAVKCSDSAPNVVRLAL
ncbi:dedicator of cytokinesis protein 5-like [Macrobrachium nipponense]|uniref:dedicator of cytokinesis protein 5-like n=1 Tax=Macrobrachium nipponense TaxID=159736 RepID=UPI0030C7A3FD